MKITHYISVLIVVLSFSTDNFGQSNKTTSSINESGKSKIEIIYFHFTRRCATCNAVEKVSKETVAGYNNKQVSFSEYNLDEEAGKKHAKQLNVSGQTLLIVSGETQINITNEGFMNARGNPEKLKEIIKKKVNSLL